MKYFVYGTNVKKEQKDIRCSSSKILLNGKLEGYKLIFNSRGVATIVPATDDEVYGVLYEIEPSRNVIAHYNPLSDRDFSRVEGNLIDWIKQLEFIRKNGLL